MLQTAVRRFSTAGKSLVDELRVRGLCSQFVGELDWSNPGKVYLGADPSAPSLHLGNLIPIMALIHFNLRGFTVMPLVGGATGIVGDPSGRLTERQQMESSRRENNAQQIHAQMISILKNGAAIGARYGYTTPGPIEPVNNLDWWKNIGFLQFLGTYGRHIRVSSMLARESVKQRLNSEQGISYGEFTYQILQAFDFWYLYSEHDCSVQIGGNDQWGNISAGLDLIGRLRPTNCKTRGPSALTVPLLTTASGEKFGKSAGNAVFIDSSLTKPYNLYQYLVNTPDSDVEQHLKMFTLLPIAKIHEIICAHNAAPEHRLAQRTLANEVTELIHGERLTSAAQTISSVIFGNDTASAKQILDAFDSQGLLKEINRNDLTHWKNVLAQVAGVSKSQAARLLKQGAVYVGRSRRQVTSNMVDLSDIEDDLLLIRTGKTNYYPLRVV